MVTIGFFVAANWEARFLPIRGVHRKNTTPRIVTVLTDGSNSRQPREYALPVTRQFAGPAVLRTVTVPRRFAFRGKGQHP